MLKPAIASIWVLALSAAGNCALAAQDVPVVQPGGDVESRLAKVERLVQSQGLLDLMSQLQDLQHQIKQLRGDMEEQGHRIQQLTDKQGQLYVDIDRRLQVLEHGGATAGGAGNPVAGAAPGAPSQPNPPVQVLNSNTAPTPAGEGNQPPALTVQTTAADAGNPAAPAAGAATGNPAAANPPPAPTPAAAAASPATGAAGGTASNTTVAAAAPAAASGDGDAADRSYDKAFDLLKISRYDDAIAEFNNFLVTYPNSSRADSAQFWLGEAYFVSQKYQPAIAEYQKLVDAYPNSPKVSQALLKIGFCYQELGQADQAKAALESVRQRFPGTTAARMAEDRLRQIAAAPGAAAH